MATPTQRMDAAKVYACQKWPYFASGIHAISLIETPGLTSGDQATLACDRWWRVYYNPDITEEYPIAVLSGMILHELGHLIRNHAERSEQFADVDRLRWNLAGDCAINPDLMDGPDPPTPVPAWGAMPEKYGLVNNLATETYYVQLEGKLPPVQYYSIDCGSCATGKGGDYELGPPSGHALDVGITAGEAELIKRQIAMEVHKTLQGTDRGSVPAGLRRWATDFMKPHVNYMAWLRAMLRNSYDMARGQGDYSFTRPARRQQLMGPVILPGMFRPKFRAGAIIDTSGSMGDKQLAQCIAEIRGFLMQIQAGADLFVASCDAAVGRIIQVQNVKQIELVGGGGTDMCKAFTAFETMRPQMDLILCLTDCITPWPAVAPRPVTAIIQVGTGQLPTWPCKHVTIPVEEADIDT